MKRLSLCVALGFALACMSGTETPAPEPAPVVPEAPKPLPPLEAYGSADGRFFEFAPASKVFIGVDGAKIRSRPDADAEVVHEAELAMEVTVLETVGAPVTLIGRLHRWTKVKGETEGGAFEGFIFGSLLTPEGGKAFSETDGTSSAWALTYSPAHQPRLRVRQGEKVHVLDLDLTEHFQGGTLKGEAPGWGDFELGFDVSQCALEKSGSHPDCVAGSARFIDEELTQSTVTDRWEFVAEPALGGRQTCGKTPLKLNRVEPTTVMDLELPSYMRGGPSEVPCKKFGTVSGGEFAGADAVECVSSDGGKASPSYVIALRFLVKDKTWTRSLCASDTGADEVLDRLADTGIKVRERWDLPLQGMSKRETLSVERGVLTLVRHEHEDLKSLGEPLFVHPELGPVYANATGDVAVPQPTGHLRYSWAPQQISVPGDWDAGRYGCGGDVDEGNIELPGFKPSGEPTGDADGSPLYALQPGSELYAKLEKDVRAAFKYSPDGLSDDVLANTPWLAVQDPWGRWVLLTRKSLRVPNMCEPIVYLYSDPPREVSVRFGKGLEVDRTWPPTEGGWDALALPDGRVEVQGQRYDHLFWDGRSVHFPPAEQGWVVPRASLSASLREHLPSLGLRGREIDEAIAAWKVPGESAWVRIGVHPRDRVERIAPLDVYPRPDTAIRVFVELEGATKHEPMEPPPAARVERKGLVFVEWGLVERRGR